MMEYTNILREKTLGRGGWVFKILVLSYSKITNWSKTINIFLKFGNSAHWVVPHYLGRRLGHH